MENFKRLLLAVLVACFSQTGSGQFMPGSSPATPNSALIKCQSEAILKPRNLTIRGQHAFIINLWCSTYESMLPCLETNLPKSMDPNDWFLNLVFKRSTAMSTSKKMCSNFPRSTNLTCVDTGIARVSACIRSTTGFAINHFYNLYDSNSTVAEENREAASIYACIISVATASCFRRELKACNIPARKLLYDYYIMLSGRCKEIAGEPDNTTAKSQTVSQPPMKPTDDTTVKVTLATTDTPSSEDSFDSQPSGGSEDPGNTQTISPVKQSTSRRPTNIPVEIQLPEESDEGTPKPTGPPSTSPSQRDDLDEDRSTNRPPDDTRDADTTGSSSTGKQKDGGRGSSSAVLSSVFTMMISLSLVVYV